MTIDTRDYKAGYAWLVGASVFLVAFISFIIWTDNTVTNSKREEQLEATLKELRGAQSGLASGVSDSRQTFEVPMRVSEVSAPISEEHAENHAK